jgi:hypothetical protein
MSCAVCLCSSSQTRFGSVLDVFPYFVGNVKIGETFHSKKVGGIETCFQNTTFMAQRVGLNYEITINFENPRNFWCGDGYFISTLGK